MLNELIVVSDSEIVSETEINTVLPLISHTMPSAVKMNFLEGWQRLVPAFLQRARAKFSVSPWPSARSSNSMQSRSRSMPHA